MSVLHRRVCHLTFPSVRACTLSIVAASSCQLCTLQHAFFKLALVCSHRLELVQVVVQGVILWEISREHVFLIGGLHEIVKAYESVIDVDLRKLQNHQLRRVVQSREGAE